MATVAVASHNAREFRDHFVRWSREQGIQIVSEPPESAGVDDTVNFSCVPDEFLTALGATGFIFTKISA